MPQQRAHGGAAMLPINLTSPAFLGLNTEQESSLLGPEWATTLSNAVFDGSGRPAVRNGWLDITTSAGTGAIMQVFEYWKANGTSEILCSTDANIYSGTTTLSSVKGTLTITDGNIKFANFNDKCIAFGIGTGGLPAVYTGTTFANITVNSQCPDATNPSGTVGMAAFGRLWVFRADGKTLQYSALLDETRWATADGGGIIDFSKVWPAGQDAAVAIVEFAGDLVVFGKNNTVIMTDGAGAALGVDPDNLYVSDTLPGIGARSQFAMCRAAGDFWFLSNSGILGLRRELQQKSTPLTNISANVQTLVNTWADAEADEDDITLEYCPQEDFVVVVFPSSERQIVFDTRAPTQGGGYRATTWTAPLQTVAYIRNGRKLYGTYSAGANGNIFEYSGYEDNGSSFTFEYDSGWLDLGQELSQYLKMVKYVTSVVYVGANVDVVHKVGYDFGVRTYSTTKSAAGGAVAEFNISEFSSSWASDPGRTFIGYIDPADTSKGESIYSGGIQLRTMKAPGQGSGQYVRVGVAVDTNSGGFAIQQLNLFAKIGRMAV